jgi:hypothetical protein
MWLFTRYGFYSIACASQPNGSIDPGTLMIRARLVAHLTNLQERFPALKVGEIVALPNRDYRYRLIVSKEVWADALAELGREQDWANFKNEVARFNGRDEYERALHAVWEVMYDLQERAK